jgi:hypothetical protein
MIVKLQLSLSDPDAPIFVYDQKRAINRLIAQREVPSALMKALTKYFKIYCDAETTADGLVLGAEQPAQPW